MVDQHDLYEWFLDLGALSNINERYFHGEAPTWNAFARHPNMDEYWETFRTRGNEWETFESWPPPSESLDVYLHAGRHVSFDPPAAGGDGPAGSEYDEYVSDPWNPVPYRSRPIQWDGWPTWQAEDQRLAHGRPDVLFWESEPLEEDLTMSGDPVARLFASTSGTASDWVVKLIDVYPEDYGPNPQLRGYQYMVAGEVFRGRHRNSYREPEPIPRTRWWSTGSPCVTGATRTGSNTGSWCRFRAPGGSQGPSKYSTTILATSPMRISATADGPATSLL